jgi:succinate dehydrogenase / fumarate reductase cytochrome b subunit
MTAERPLSPHLQIYKPQITSVLSILHRATGVALSIGLFVLTWWLLAAASGPDAYDQFRRVASSPVGVFFLMGWSYAVFYHFCSGIRHLIMDTGRLFTLPEIYKGGYIMLAASVVLTVIFWCLVLFKDSPWPPL